MRGSFFQAIFFSTLFLIIAWGSFQLSLIENLGKKDSSLSITTTNNSGGALQTNNNFTSPSNRLTPPNTEQKQHFSTQIQPHTKDKTSIALLSTATSALRYCPPPGNWNAIFIQPGDTIASLSRKYQISPQQLLEQTVSKIWIFHLVKSFMFHHFPLHSYSLQHQPNAYPSWLGVLYHSTRRYINLPERKYT
jgi:hypothetical protein